MTSLTFVSLLLVAVMASTVSAQGGISSCCRSIGTTRVHRENLRSYYKQHKPSCPIEAVVFTTVLGKRICSDPVGLWTQTSMAFLDGKNWHVEKHTRKIHPRKE